MKAPEYHVACGLFGIYAGTVKPNGKEWRNKSEVTNEAIAAVRDWMLGELKKDQTEGGYKWTTTDGRTIELILKVSETINAENA